MEVVGPIGMLLIGFGVIVCILYVAFGPITVRKLRKNPATKECLGVGLVSGWDILNAAEALALPKALTDRFEASPLSAMFANADLLREHTNTFDRVLAALFFWLFVFTAVSTLLLTSYMALFVD
ncbi:hypothetical protein [Motiliproteus sp. MSK22-1]|uniref:hypothetical protein n=1 Tax=Motiliproteus sp. MSK22-1 TaxID=1897630 RepID=UPI0009771857|nr:hypothetical protein [Motiliproteus sp. MSK22-1]OMH32797.1 hypothetical protein BGP75_14840 [Motiliproteus sp. MSK22-1]